jgi:hypothetical protein
MYILSPASPFSRRAHYLGFLCGRVLPHWNARNSDDDIVVRVHSIHGKRDSSGDDQYPVWGSGLGAGLNWAPLPISAYVSG